MKICLASYNHSPYIGGIETYSKALHLFLKKSNLEFDSITGSLVKFKIIRIINVILVTSLKILKERYDIIHLTNLNLWPIIFLKNIKNKNSQIIINLHGLEIVYGNRNNLIPKLYKLILPKKYLNSQKSIFFICNSKQTLELAKSIFDEDKLKFIPMGVEQFEKIKSFKYKINYNQIFFCGRIVERKGLSWFAENVLKNFDYLNLIIAGPIIDNREFQKLKNNPKINYIGEINNSEKKKYHETSLLTIFPNLIEDSKIDFEGFGISFIESIANNGLSLASEFQGIKTSSLNGKIGLTLKNNNPSLWINKIKEVQNWNLDTRKNKIEESQNLIIKNFLWDIVLSDTINYYKFLYKC